MPDIHGGGPVLPPVLPMSTADITEEIWQEVARQHSGGAPMREAAERARRASTPVAVSVLPAPLPLPALLGLEGAAFIEAAYATVLNRAADPAGVAYMQAELAGGRSKLELLGALQASAEGRAAGRELPGLRRRYWVRRLYRVPLAGPALRLGGVVLRRAGVARAFAASDRVDVALRAEMESRLAQFEAAMDSRRRTLEERLAEQQTAVELATRRLASVQAAQDELGRRALTSIAEQGRAVAALSEQSAGFVRQLAALEDSAIESLLSLHGRVVDHEARLAAVEGAVDVVAARGQIEAAAGALRAELDERVIVAEAVAAQNRRDVADQQRRIGLMLHALRERVPAAVDAEDDHAMDALYVAFEDRFRGTRASVKERQRVYLPRLRAVVGDARPVLDLGAGRGEFLELLREEGLAGQGVDSNEAMAAACRAAGLDCVQGDALDVLAARGDGSLGVVTGFHIAEHLPFKVLVRVMDEALRALAPGGLLVLETPNPANLLTASRYFYLDPTHRNPLPGETLAMIAEARGYVDAEIVELHPMGGRLPGSDRALAEALERMFYGPQDYALIARKA